MAIELPPLPKQNKKKEADFGIIFRRWWERNPLPGNFELKQTNGKDSIPFWAVEPDQIAFGMAAGSKKGVLARVSVGTTGCGDYIGLVSSPSWIVIKYPGVFHIIATEVFVMESKRNKRKSLLESRAREIATISV